MKQKILVPNQSMPNQFFIKSCKEKGIQLDIINDPDCINLSENVLDYDDVLGKKITLTNKLNNLSVLDEIQEIYKEKTLDYIYPSWFDFQTKTMGYLNQKLNITGLDFNTSLKMFDKLTYQTILEQEGILFPKIISCFDPYSEQYFYNNNIFPAVAKPVIGTGSIGVKVLRNAKEATEFFKDYEVPFNSYCEIGQNGYKHYDYHCVGRCYILQEYIEGTLVSLSGHVVDNDVQIDLIYDIESSKLPYRAETGFTYPSQYSSLKLKHIVDKIIKVLSVNNSPFMMDFIYKDGSYYLIDFSARFSTSTQYVMNYLGEKDYAFNVVNKILNNVDFSLNLNKCISIQHLPIEKGKIKSIKINKEYCLDIKLPKIGSQQYQSRIDVYAGNKGFIVVEAEDLETIKNKIKKTLNTLEVTYV